MSDIEVFYNVFDAMPLDEWVAQESKMIYRDRVKLVQEVVLACVDFKQDSEPRVRQVPHIMAHDEAELKAYFVECLEQNFEGVMLKRMDIPYEWDRSKNILKLKPIASTEGTVVGWYEGRRGTKHEGAFGGFDVVFVNGVVTRVGGGFNDTMRAEIQLNGPDMYVGKLVECEFQPDPVSLNGFTEDGKLRFPVFMRVRPESDVDPAIVEAGRKFIQSTHG